MHKEQRAYTERAVKAYYAGGNVVEIGSKDINGSNRNLFGTDYVGIDLSSGKNVDVVIHFADSHFEDVDFILSTEALEHDYRWRETLQKIVGSLKEGGYAVITAAGMGRPEHGTTRTTPQDSPDTTDYYANLSAKHVYSALRGLNCEVVEMIETRGDIYFTIRKGGVIRKDFLERSVLQFFGVQVGNIHDIPTLVDVPDPSLACALTAVIDCPVIVFLPNGYNTGRLLEYNPNQICVVSERRFSQEFLRSYKVEQLITSYQNDIEIWKRDS